MINVLKKTKKELLDDVCSLQKRVDELEGYIASLSGYTEHLDAERIKYQTLFESSGDAIFIMEHGKIIDCNQKTLEMFRFPKEKVVGSCPYDDAYFWTVFQPDGSTSREHALKLMQFVQEGNNGPFLWRHRRGDGNSFDSEVSFSHVVLGGKDYLMSIVRDITDRHYVEELYKTIADTSRAGVFIVKNGRFKFLNPNWLKYLNYGEQELLEMDSLSFVHPDDRESVRMNSIAMLKGLRNTPYEYRVITKGGNVRHIIETSTSIVYEGKEASLCNSMDITELKETRLKLDELQLLETSILKTISHAVLGLQHRKIIFVNPAAEKIFGWRAEELLGQDIRVLYRNENEYEETGKFVYSMLEKGGPCSIEVPCRHKDGRDFFCVLNVTSIDKDVHKGRIVTTYEDITDRKKAEEEKARLEAQLIQSQKMEAIGTLAGGLAHDFNNLLMGIQGCTSILMQELRQAPDYYERLQSIEHYIRSGADLTRQLLGFARGDKYEFKTSNINELVEKTAALFARTKKEITIHRFFNAAAALAEVDRGQIEQMLLNLLVNAWQAMPQGGDIYLQTENVLLDDDFVRSYNINSGYYIRISVADSGVGMDARTRERIFEPFFTTKEMGRGTGLGLAMVYGIVLGHKGIITVDSKPGEGTAFNIYLPVSEKEMEMEMETGASQDIIKGHETILFVDDEKNIIEVTQEILELLGYKVFTANSGYEAVKIYSERKNEIDLVIQDMVMPGMNGLETFYALKIINPDVKVILSSGYVMNQQMQTVMEQGCRAFIQKPFRIEEISVKIREVLDKP